MDERASERHDGLWALRRTGVVLWIAPLLSGCGARSSLEAPVGEECVLETASLQVPSTAPWFDTGIDVSAGQRLYITATGTVRYGGKEKQITDPDGGHYTGKKLFTTAVLPTTVVVSLVGKVGGTNDVDTGAPLPEGLSNNGPGFVGASYDEIVVEGGRLFLGFNDLKNAFGDNSGVFNVTIALSC